MTVNRFWKVGGFDYKKVPELGGVNLNFYRVKTGGQLNPRAIQIKPPNPI